MVAEAFLPSSLPPILCFSHLRWNFVTQRPQHILGRLAKATTVIFIEEPLEGPEVHLSTSVCSETGVTIATPILPANIDTASRQAALTRMIATLGAASRRPPILWY